MNCQRADAGKSAQRLCSTGQPLQLPQRGQDSLYVLVGLLLMPQGRDQVARLGRCGAQHIAQGLGQFDRVRRANRIGLPIATALAIRVAVAIGANVAVAVDAVRLIDSRLNRGFGGLPIAVFLLVAVCGDGGGVPESHGSAGPSAESIRTALRLGFTTPPSPSETRRPFAMGR